VILVFFYFLPYPIPTKVILFLSISSNVVAASALFLPSVVKFVFGS